MTDHYCPDCTSVLLPGATRCPCGWDAAAKPKAAAKKGAGAICRKCGAPATTTEAGLWWCREHAQKAREYLIEKQNKQRRDAPALDWREQLIREHMAQQQKAER